MPCERPLLKWSYSCFRGGCPQGRWLLASASLLPPLNTPCHMPQYGHPDPPKRHPHLSGVTQTISAVAILNKDSVLSLLKLSNIVTQTPPSFLFSSSGFRYDFGSFMITLIRGTMLKNTITN
jgi:hypothetical protein